MARGKLGLLVLVVIFSFLFTECEQQFDNYYKVPGNLIGTIVDVLKEDGNYTLFCQALEMVDYADIIGKTGNFTVFAPNDSAFREYFRQSGYAALDDIPAEELRSVIMYHIVFWSYSRYKLLYGLGIEEENSAYTTDNFRKETRYKPPITAETDSTGRNFNTFHEYKYVNVFSSEYFQEHKLDGSFNYAFFYPGSSYSGFQVDNARILQYDIPAQNGWIHKIDKVLIPPDNHEQILNKHPEFSEFRALLNKWADYTYDDASTHQQKGDGDINNDGKLDSLFRKTYQLNSNIFSLDVENVDGNGQSRTLTLFAPTNEALQQFMIDHTTGYSSIHDIDTYWINWYLSHYIGYNYWPSQLAHMTTDWSMPLVSITADGNVGQDNIVFSRLSSNGQFYGINKYLLPRSFEMAAGPVFGNKDFEWFCELLIFYKVDILLNNPDIHYTVFAPTNEAMAMAGYSAREGLGGFGLYQAQNPLSPVPRSRAVDLIKSHIIAGEMQPGDYEAGTFLKTVQNTYIGVEEGGIFGGGDPVVIPLGTPENSDVNGIVYPIENMLISPASDILEVLSDQTNHPEFLEFFKLLQASGLILLDAGFNYTLLSNLATGVSYTCMIPTNQAIVDGKAAGLIPDDPEQLKQFLRYHFIEGMVFSDGRNGGTYKTTRYADVTHNNYSTLNVLNEKYNLRVQDHQGNIRHVLTGNIMTSNGVIHQIDSLLIY
jgi:uncharacterized surface protein with fasciclin (FAS1) repeats